MTSPNASLAKRLFLFAAYDKDCLIDDTLLYYLEALSKLGDIIFTMDNDTPAKEMAKLDRIPNILHASAQRHGEYDFGSYKRGYIWANDNQILDNYDWIYLTNDSVLGPMGDLESMLVNIESRGADCVGMVSNDPQLLPAHIQSWFVGLKRHVATSKFFRDFITNVAHQTDKLSVVYKYEVRMSQMLVENGCTYAALFENYGPTIYTNPHLALKAGVPFIKKLALGKLQELQLLYTYTGDRLVASILIYAVRHGIALSNKVQQPQYIRRFRITMMGVPILTIYSQFDESRKAYKLYIFDKIPIVKIWFQSNHSTQEA